MNIGIVTTWFPAGGGYVSKAYRDILSKEHNVFIYARGGKVMKNDPIWDDNNVYWAPRYYNGIRTNNLLKWSKNNNINILFFNEQRYWKPVIAAKKAGICIGAYVDYYKQSTVKAFGIYDFLICNTKRHYSVFNWHESAHYIPWGTTIKKTVNNVRPNRIFTFLISAGWEGSFSGDRRGTLFTIEAFKKVTGNCRLLIYSQVELVKCLPIWQEKICSDQRITFIFGTFDPFPYSEGDVFIYPSKLDGIGLTLPEALSNGLPSITTNAPPMNEFVIDGLNGFLVKVDKYLGREDGYYWAESHCNIESLTNEMQKFVSGDLNFLNDLQNKTYNNAFTYLDWSKNAANLPAIFLNEFNKVKTIDEELFIYAKKLDRQMAPSFQYKLLSLAKAYLLYIFKN